MWRWRYSSDIHMRVLVNMNSSLWVAFFVLSASSTLGSGASKKKRPCVDRNPGCKKWADLGECPRNPSFMLARCSLSCGACDSSSAAAVYSKAKDYLSGSQTDPQCETWASHGDCATNPTYMLERCPAACNKFVWNETVKQKCASSK